MFNKEKECVSISLSEDTLKIVSLKVSSAEHKLVNVTKRDIRGVSEEELPKIIQSGLRDLNVKKPNAVCVIPSNVITTKNIEIPSLDPEEIKSIIDLQAGRHTPYSREEILIGYITIGVFQRNYTQVLLVIVNRDVVKNQLAILDSAGVKVDKVLFAPEGMARFYAWVLKVKEEDVPVGIIDIANQTTDFAIEFNNTLATCRSIPLGMNHLLKDGPPAQEKLVAEVLKSLEAYQNEDINKAPETYILTSDDAKIKELQPVLQDKLKANVKIMPYLDRIQASQPIMLKLVSEYNDDSFFNLVSVAVVVDKMNVDLMPDEIKVQRAIQEKGRQLIKAGVFGLIVLFLICAIFFGKIHFKSIYLDRLQEVYLEKRRAVVSLDRVAQKTRIIKDYLNSRMVSLEVVKELYILIPEEIHLEHIVLDEQGKISIQGVSESMSRVFNFVSALEDSDFFKSVKTKSTTAKKDRGKDVAAFEIEFKLESARDDKEVDGGINPGEEPPE